MKTGYSLIDFDVFISMQSSEVAKSLNLKKIAKNPGFSIIFTYQLIFMDKKNIFSIENRVDILTRYQILRHYLSYFPRYKPLRPSVPSWFILNPICDCKRDIFSLRSE